MFYRRESQFWRESWSVGKPFQNYLSDFINQTGRRFDILTQHYSANMTDIRPVEPQNAPYTICSLEVHIVYPAYTICSPLNREHIVYDMYLTYTICSLAEERSRGRVLDPISMGCGLEPHLKHCVVFLNMTLNILCSVLVSPR